MDDQYDRRPAGEASRFAMIVGKRRAVLGPFLRREWSYRRAWKPPSNWNVNVKWFNSTKGYGFIQPQAGGKDVFVHISAVERAGLSTLKEGQHLEYKIEENRGKASAVHLKVK